MDQYKRTGSVNDKARAEKQAHMVAKSIITGGVDMDNMGANSFFYEASESLLTSAIMILSEYGEPETRHISSAHKLKIRCISAREKKSIRTRFKDVIFPNARQYLNVDASTCFVEESSKGTLEFILTVQNAIMERKKILFYYMTMDEYMRPIRKHNGKRYKVSPYYMFFSSETMYLFAAEDDSPIIKTYRIDRMDGISITSEEIVSPGKYMKGDAEKELRKRAAETIDNFDGPEIAVYLDVPYTPTAMNIISDCVGKNAEVLHYDKETGHDLIRINVRRSPTLASWLYQNIEFFSVISPQCIIDDVVERSVWNIKAYSTT